MEKALDTIVTTLSKWCQTETIAVSESLRIDSLDIDSMNMIEVQLAIENQLSISVDDDKFFAAETIGDLVELVSSALRE